MTEADWHACDDAGQLLVFLSNETNDRKLQLFAVACCRRIEHLLRNKRSRNAIAMAERYADRAVRWETCLRAGEAAEEVCWEAEVGLRTYSEPERAAARAVSLVCGEDCMTMHVVAQEAMIAATRCFEGGDRHGEKVPQAALLKDIFGNPFRPVAFSRDLRTDIVSSLARRMYESRDFSAMPVLADALQDAGCANDEVLDHCRGLGPHVRGCWVVDLVLGKG